MAATISPALKRRAEYPCLDRTPTKAAPEIYGFVS